MTTDWSTLHKQVIFGEAGGRIIWQPRILAWYKDKVFFGEPFPAPFTGMNLYEIYRELGCSHRLYDEYNSCLRRVEHPSVQDHRALAQRARHHDHHRDAGGQAGEGRAPRASSWWMQEIKREVTTEEELKVAAWREENTTWEFDQARFDELQADGRRPGRAHHLHAAHERAEPLHREDGRGGGRLRHPRLDGHDRGLLPRAGGEPRPPDRRAQRVAHRHHQLRRERARAHAAADAGSRSTTCPPASAAANGCTRRASSATRTGTATSGRCSSTRRRPGWTASRPSRRSRRAT